MTEKIGAWEGELGGEGGAGDKLCHFWLAGEVYRGYIVWVGVVVWCSPLFGRRDKAEVGNFEVLASLSC